MNGIQNGRVKTHLERIEGSLEEIRDDLATAVRDLTRAVDTLSERVNTTSTMWGQAVPIKVVAYMFGILVLTIAGVEGIKFFFARLH